METAPNLESYVQRWNLSNASILTKTERATLYIVKYQGEPAVLKLLTEDGMADEKSGPAFLKLMNGFPCIRLLRQAQSAVLLEYVPGSALQELVAQGKDDEATQIMASLLNEMHKIAVPNDHEFISLEQRFRSLFNRSQTIYEKQFAKGASLAHSLLDNPESHVLLHGDMHHENVLNDANGIWIVIDPKGLVGDRAYDAANIFLNPWNMPEIVRDEKRFLRQVDIVSEVMRISTQKLIDYAFAHACLSALWFIEDYGEPSEHALAIMEMMEPITSIA